MRRSIQLGQVQETALVPLYARALPHVTIALDTAGRRAVEAGNRDHARHELAARFAWACDDPIAIQQWNIGLRLAESRTTADVPDGLWPRLSLPLGTTLRLLGRFFAKQMKVYQLNVFAGLRPESGRRTEGAR